MRSQTGSLRFETYELDAGTGELRKAGRNVKIQPQPLKVLAYLASRPGELVTREELREAVWGSETFVDFEQGLNQCIRQIRAVLQDNSDKPRYIETLPKRGYRFVASVAVEGPRDPPKAPARGRSLPRRRALAALVVAGSALAVFLLVRNRTGLVGAAGTSLAVLPFADFSPEDHQYFAHGLTEEIASRLSADERLRVAGRASAFALPANSGIREAASRLRVRNVLTGSVRVYGDSVRVTIQLLDAGEDRILWSQDYDRKLADILGVQAEIAQSVASALKERFGIEGSAGRILRRPSSLEAYNLYLRALYVGRKLTRPALDQAIDMLDRTIHLEPGFAAAYAQLAHFHLRVDTMGLSAGEPDRLDRARTAALRAEELEPDSAEAQTVLSYAALRQFRWKEAEARTEKAVQLDPNHGWARDLRATVHIIRGEVAESLRESERAVELEPLSLIVNHNRGETQFFARRYDDALRTLKEVQQLDPEFTWAYYTATRVHVQKGNCREAIESAKKHSSLVGLPTTVLALAVARCEGPEAGRRAIEEHQRKARGGPVAMPAVYAAIGDREKALRALEIAVEKPRSAWMWYLKVNPELDSLRAEPRFQEVMWKMGLQQ